LFTLQVQAHLAVKKNLQPGWSVAWLQRPLEPQLLEYAVYDVLSILALYRHFQAAGTHSMIAIHRYDLDAISASLAANWHI
jgi:3-deoxy-D-arabino-heptulosonate 7-phosphate (DAHP) synthase class II